MDICKHQPQVGETTGPKLRPSIKDHSILPTNDAWKGLETISPNWTYMLELMPPFKGILKAFIGKTCGFKFCEEIVNKWE